MSTETAQLISIMQEQLKLQRQQLEEQRRQAKEQLDQAKAQAKTLLQEQRRQAEAREEEQRRQAEAREERLIQALTMGATKTGALFPVASGSIPKFTPFDASVELWKDYLARFTTFVGANSIPAEKTAQVFLTSQSTTIYKLLGTVAGQQDPPKDVNKLSMEDINAFMEQQYDPKRFVVRERFRFWSNMQRKPGETAQELAARIRQEAATCDFASIRDPQDEALRTKFICSIGNEAVLKALFKIKDDELTFTRAVEVTMETEDAAKAAKETVHGPRPTDSSTPIYKVNPKQASSKRKVIPSSPFAKGICPRCGKTGHHAKECRFIDATCRFCQKKGHIEAVCLKKKGTQSQKKQSIGFITRDPTQTVYNIPGHDPIVQRLQINGKQFHFEVDSGARDNFCSKKVWTELGRPKLRPARIRYVSAAGQPLPILGTFKAKACVGNPLRYQTIILNVSPCPRLNLLGRTAIHQLGIDILMLLQNSGSTPGVDKVNTIQKNDTSDQALHDACLQMCRNFPDLFIAELGCLKDIELEVAFKQNVKPIFCKPRTVPYAILDELNVAYDEGIRKGIWIPTQFNDYGTPVVPVRKALLPGQRKRRLRICGDYSVTVNAQLETHRYPIPRPEDLMHKLSGGYYFSKIDLADAYNQIKLGSESQKRLALSTHRGILLQTRLPFGISSAPGYFQEIMDQLTRDLSGVAVYLDDLLVSGANAEEHLQNLQALLQRLQDKGLRCNLEKCCFAQSSVEYLGHTLSRDGISKGHKVNAVLQMPPPKDVSTLRSFLGSVQFYAKFIPNLSSRTEPLTRLTRKDTPWRWGTKEQTTFQELKDLLCTDTVLAHFDPAKQIGISCDASNIGIGAVLFHRYDDGSERPIANVSKTLTDTQRRYSQIQKEALAVIYGLKKFHQFLYGRNFILVTDHKPLVTLLGPTKGTPTLAANRLARWALILSQYKYQIEYRRTADHANADALSRLPAGLDNKFDREEQGADVSTVCAVRVIDKQLNPTRPGLLAKESRKDPVIATVMRYVKEGWPHTETSKDILHYKRLEDSLTVEKGCLFLGARIVVPDKLRDQVLQLIHLGHFGMQRMKQLARSVVYWPHINEHIEQVSRTCTACAEHQNKPPKPANHPWMLPETPWSRIHVDHAIQFMGTNWLVLIDAYSKYPCIHPTNSTTTKATMDLLEEDFAHFGYPHALVTDNATTFLSEEFQAWCRERGITHLTGAPYHPATNGAAERLVQTFKKAIKKSSLPPKVALQEFLLQYRRTPLDSDYSPSELLNGRQIRCKLDTLLPSPAHVAQGKQARRAAIEQQRDHHRLVSRLVHMYTVGALCYALYYGPRRNKQPQWVPAVVTKVFGTRTVNVRVVPRGPTWRRHIDQLRPRYGANEDTDPGKDLRLDSTDRSQKAEGTNTTDHTPTLPPNPSESTDFTPKKKQREQEQRSRKARLPPPDAEYGLHNPRRSERIQSRK